MIPKLRPDTQHLLDLARAFAEVMYGAGILYRRIVAQLSLPDGGSLDRFEAHAKRFVAWSETLKAQDVDLVLADIDQVVRLGVLTRHTIGPDTLSFVKGWAALCRDAPALPNSHAAEELVSKREVALKAHAGTSRIRSKPARERWRGGEAQRLDYRWGTAHRFLNDLAGFS